MKILVEASLINTAQIDAINKLSGSKRAEAIIKIIREDLFPDIYDTIINTKKRETNILNSLVQSIDEYGWDTNNNKTLAFMMSLNKPLPIQGFNLASKLLQDNFISLAGNDWLKDPQSYDPLYKAKALAFLSNEKASAYGEDAETAKKAISELTDEAEIKNYLSNWQTKSGEDNSDKDSGEDILLNWLRRYTDIRALDNTNRISEFIKFIKNSDMYKKLDNESKTVIDGKFDSVDVRKILNKLLSDEYTDEQIFYQRLENYLKQLAK